MSAYFHDCLYTAMITILLSAYCHSCQFVALHTNICAFMLPLYSNTRPFFAFVLSGLCISYQQIVTFGCFLPACCNYCLFAACITANFLLPVYSIQLPIWQPCIVKPCLSIYCEVTASAVLHENVLSGT